MKKYQKHLFVKVIFYSDNRKHLPANGYRPDAIFHNDTYWGISFMDLPMTDFDISTPAIIVFTFQEKHYNEVSVGQKFKIMEGAKQVGEGEIISIEN